MCFNPRAREGRDRVIAARDECPRVSIHAPARGATVLFAAGGCHLVVSIHAPARGATAGASFALMTRMSFNPRAREGRDMNHNNIL